MMASARRGIVPIGCLFSNLAISSSVQAVKTLHLVIEALDVDHDVPLNPLAPLLDSPGEHLAQLGYAPVGGCRRALFAVPEQPHMVGRELGDRAVLELELRPRLGRLFQDRAHHVRAHPLLALVGARELVRLVILVDEPPERPDVRLVRLSRPWCAS
jgi:hypothetical protein